MKRDVIVYIISNVTKAIAFEWIIEEYNKRGINIQFILLNDRFDTPLANYIRENGLKSHQIKLGSRINFLLVLLKLIKILWQIKPKVVHTHLFEASLLGLMAAKLTGVKRRIYTRHHSTYHHEYFPKSVKYDKWINYLATTIIAISNNVKNVLLEKENVKEGKVVLVEHGFKMNQFSAVNLDRIELIRKKYNIPKDEIVIGCISRYIEWKGIEYLIRAFKTVYERNSNTHLLLANASGDYKNAITKELSSLPQSAYTEVVFEEDLFALYRLMNVYVHIPINERIEAFGQTYIESLASKVPSIFTLSGIANDFVIHKKNALVVDYKNSNQIETSILELIENEDLRKQLVEQGQQDVKRFELNRMIDGLAEHYL